MSEVTQQEIYENKLREDFGITEEQMKASKEKAEKKEKVSNNLITYDKEGMALFENQSQLATVAKFYIQTKLAPESLRKEGPEAVASAIALCRSLNIPDTCMGEMAYINGKIGGFGSLITALAERHKDYGQRKDIFIDKDCNEICLKNKNLKEAPYGAVIQIKKKGEDHWNEYTFTVDDAIQAGLLTEKLVSTKSNSKDATWTKYTRDMLWHKANARALKANYSSAIKGIAYLEDIREVFEPKTRDVSDVENANNVNAFFKDGE